MTDTTRKPAVYTAEAMPAGRELDVLVAERVMGWNADIDSEDGSFWGYCGVDAPDLRTSLEWRPSIDIAAAWKVVEAMKGRGMKVNLYDRRPIGWACLFDSTHEGASPTAPHAICLAALAAMDAINAEKKGATDE